MNFRGTRQSIAGGYSFSLSPLEVKKLSLGGSLGFQLPDLENHTPPFWFLSRKYPCPRDKVRVCSLGLRNVSHWDSGWALWLCLGPGPLKFTHDNAPKASAMLSPLIPFHCLPFFPSFFFSLYQTPVHSLEDSGHLLASPTAKVTYIKGKLTKEQSLVNV